VGKSLQDRSFARHPHYAVAHARGYDAASHLQAMDEERVKSLEDERKPRLRR